MRAFMIMPFKPQYSNLFEYGYLPICREFDITLERTLEDPKPGKIITNILDKIRAADLIIADVSEPNPNVFFEIGYAFCLNKTIIFSTESVNNTPFDINQEFQLEHHEMISEIEKRLPEFLPKAIEHRFGFNLIKNPHLSGGLAGWRIRTSTVEKYQCLLEPKPKIDENTSLGKIPSIKIYRKQKEDIPLKNGHSTIDIRKYIYRGEEDVAINVESLKSQSITVNCFAFIKSDKELKHRFRVIFSKRPTGSSEQHSTSFESISPKNSWTFFFKKRRLKIPAKIKYIRFLIDTKGSNEESTHWVACPFFSIVESE